MLKSEIFFKIKKKKKCIDISVFGYENKENYSIYLSKNIFKKNFDLLLIQENHKRNYFFINDFNTLMHGHTLHHRRKYFYCYSLLTFSPEEI